MHHDAGPFTLVHLYVMELHSETATAGLYAIVPQRFPATPESDRLDEQDIIHTLRHNREFSSEMQTQPISSNPQFKAPPTKSYPLVDVFTCTGSRYQLEDRKVLVELYRYTEGDRRYWANIYYLDNLQRIVARIDITPKTVPFAAETILAYARLIAEFNTTGEAQPSIFDLLAKYTAINNELLQHYIGGQLEILMDERHRSYYCTIGEIQSIRIEQPYLHVHYAWVAQFNIGNSTWYHDPLAPSIVKLKFNPLPHQHLGSGTIMFDNLATGERMRFFHPKDSNKLNTRSIRGFSR